MGGNADALPFPVVAQAVIAADDLVILDIAETERHAAVIADVTGSGQCAVGEAVDDDAFVQQRGGIWFSRYFMGERDGIPGGGEGAPVAFTEGAAAR
jgi:hypothetical protein